MSRSSLLVAAVVALLSSAALADKQERDDLAGPPPEVAKDGAKVDVPPAPAFALPAVEPGFHSPRELRVRGRALLGSDVQVKGYVTAVYDCAAALAVTNPKATRAQITASIAKNPGLCEPPKFHLGDSKDTPRELSIEVADAPTAKTKPAAPKLGDYLTVTGSWDVQSPHNEHNPDGLLIYKTLEHAKPAAAGGAPPATSPADAAPADIDVVTAAPLRTAVDVATRTQSINHLNACNKAFAAQQYDPAIAECKLATQTWPGNHLAWYVEGSAHMAKNEWPAAQAATQRAVSLRPDQAMYQLYDGIARYEAERARVRDEAAQRDGKPADQVVINPAQLKLDAARDALRRAAKLDGNLWRAHFYLGRVDRDLDDARGEAEQFRLTIATHPAYRFAYVALDELYRRWGFNDEAIAIALLGTQHVAAAETGELWYEAGMAYDARHDDASAIDAFGKAIAARPDDASSKLQRGQLYFRKGDFANAKRDLDDIVASTDPKVAPARALAAQLLAQIARKH